jgi:hypothetical protein
MAVTTGFDEPSTGCVLTASLPEDDGVIAV